MALLAVAFEALGKANHIEVVFLDQIQGLVDEERVDDGRTRALVTAILGKVANDGNASAFFQRKDLVAVFQ